MSGYPEYCAVIRTLGKAGEKFEKEIASLLAQEHRPVKILAYIPHGYDIPQFDNASAVEFVRTEKGMVTQRSQPFDEVMTPYVLFLDDDVYLPPKAVKKLFDALIKYDGDCIAPNVFSNHQTPIAEKLFNMLRGVRPHRDKRWAFKINSSITYNYNARPSEVMFTQSNAGTCALCKFEVSKNIHFEDERWIDKVGYPEDQVFFYKMYISGYKLLTHFNCGIVHLDAATAKEKAQRKDAYLKTTRTLYLTWLRTSYMLASNSRQRVYRTICYYMQQSFALLGDWLLALKGRGRFYFTTRIKGIIEGKRIAKTDFFTSLPPYDAYKISGRN